ncbi:MAG: energy transducer TonB [Aquificaceae bacterium]
MTIKNIEDLLYWLISLVLNLILFSLLSAYLFIKVHIPGPTQPLSLYVEEVPQIEEIRLTSGKSQALQKPKAGEGIVKKGKEKVDASPMEVLREKADVHVPAGEPKEETSILQEIEQRIKGREKEVEKEGSRGEDLGNIVAVVSPSGVGLSSSGRATLYVPPLPKIVSDEPLSPLKVRVWVEPSGVVSRVQIIQRSGSPSVDQRMLEFVKGIRFEPIREKVIQTGIITFRFKGG